MSCRRLVFASTSRRDFSSSSSSSSVLAAVSGDDRAGRRRRVWLVDLARPFACCRPRETKVFARSLCACLGKIGLSVRSREGELVFERSLVRPPAINASRLSSVSWDVDMELVSDSGDHLKSRLWAAWDGIVGFLVLVDRFIL